MCALKLAGHLFEAEPARPRARQLIRRCEPQVVCRFRPLPEGFGAFTGCLLPVGGRPAAVVGCLRAIGSRPRPVPPRTRQEVLSIGFLVVLQIVQMSQLVPTFRAAITERGSSI